MSHAEIKAALVACCLKIYIWLLCIAPGFSYVQTMKKKQNNSEDYLIKLLKIFQKEE